MDIFFCLISLMSICFVSGVYDYKNAEKRKRRVEATFKSGEGEGKK